ncbi:hypothetical protein BC833DRAFT_239051 [Globomyces pollinis-pini]|nr:hypothetical protein BC833DRAFT_239051 [Globomyces pollinis-pini]
MAQSEDAAMLNKLDQSLMELEIDLHSTQSSQDDLNQNNRNQARLSGTFVSPSKLQARDRHSINIAPNSDHYNHFKNFDALINSNPNRASSPIHSFVPPNSGQHRTDSRHVLKAHLFPSESPNPNSIFPQPNTNRMSLPVRPSLRVGVNNEHASLSATLPSSNTSLHSVTESIEENDEVVEFVETVERDRSSKAFKVLGLSNAQKERQVVKQSRDSIHLQALKNNSEYDFTVPPELNQSQSEHSLNPLAHSSESLNRPSGYASAEDLRTESVSKKRISLSTILTPGKPAGRKQSMMNRVSTMLQFRSKPKDSVTVSDVAQLKRMVAGYMKKSNGSLQNQKSRYFILTDGELFEFKSHQRNQKSVGSILIDTTTNFTVVNARECILQISYFSEHTLKEEMWYLQCESGRDLNIWSHGFEKAIFAKQGSPNEKPPEPPLSPLQILESFKFPPKQGVVKLGSDVSSQRSTMPSHIDSPSDIGDTESHRTKSTVDSVSHPSPEERAKVEDLTYPSPEGVDHGSVNDSTLKTWFIPQILIHCLDLFQL